MARNKVSLGKRITLSLKRRFSPKDLAELAEINAVSTVILSIDRTDIKGYVQDVVEAFISVIKANLSGFHTFNVGSGTGICIQNAAKQIAQTLQAPLHIEKFPEPLSFSQDVFISNIKRLQNKTGWAPKISFQEGIQFMRNRYV